MKKLGLIVVALCLFAGCYNAHNVHNTVDATGFNFISAKKGEDCKYAILGVLPISKTDVDAAAAKANIRSLGFVEYSYDYYFLFSKQCVVVYGK